MTIRSGISPQTMLGHGFAGAVKCIGADVAVATAGLALNATTDAIRVPAGFTVTGVQMSATDLDSNASATVVLALGDSADPDRIVSGATIGQAGGATNVLAATGVNYTYTADTTLQIAATTAAATAAAGTVKVLLFGVLSNAATS